MKQEEELRNINGIKNISKIAMVGASRIPFSREMLGDELYNSLMNRPEYASYIDKNGDFIWTVEICLYILKECTMMKNLMLWYMKR